MNSDSSIFEVPDLYGPNLPITTDTSVSNHNNGSLLPPLFNDNIDAFQFDDIFLGSTEADLDSFFADVFSLPTYPRLGGDEYAPLLTSALQPSVSGYNSDADV
jgi:hypothetical protein